MNVDEWPEALHMLRSELHVVQEELRGEETVESAGGISEAVPGDDVGLRQGTVDAIAKDVAEVFGQSLTAEGADNVHESNADTGAPVSDGNVGGSAEHTTQNFEYPRVAPPEVQDEVGQAVREDTPGYIAMAFPKLFPHDTGDFHELRQNFRKLLSFEDWGRFVMMWHDGRFIRHSRFRYWLLDTSLRLMTPTMQRTFFKTREAATQYTLGDLENKETRRNLVQQILCD
jgi:hypothetical protein